MSFFRSPVFRRIFYVMLLAFALVRVGNRVLSSYNSPPIKTGEVVHLQH